jgi:hypothetical protein
MSRRKRLMEDLDQDIRDYIEREIQDSVERGMSPEEARYAALGVHSSGWIGAGVRPFAFSRGKPAVRIRAGAIRRRSPASRNPSGERRAPERRS